MLSLAVIIAFFGHAYACSIMQPTAGLYYISEVQLLDASTYPDFVLLTIRRSDSVDAPSLQYTNTGPWCKMMNVNDGSVGPLVSCQIMELTTRAFATPDTNTITVSCQDNCDGATATCTIVRDQINYSLTDISYVDSDSTCDSSSPAPVIVSSFTLTDTSTTYISFSSNTVGVSFNDATVPISYITFDVQREGDWSGLLPGDPTIDELPSVYSAVNVIQFPLACCMCYSHALTQYNISTSTASDGTVTQVMTLSGLGFYGGQVDTSGERAIGLGSSYSTQVRVCYLSTDSDANVLKPDLCDVMEDNTTCSACAASNCVYDFTDVSNCVDDYCGGCNARWFDGTVDVTNRCSARPATTETDTTGAATTTALGTTETSEEMGTTEDGNVGVGSSASPMRCYFGEVFALAVLSYCI